MAAIIITAGQQTLRACPAARVRSDLFKPINARGNQDEIGVTIAVAEIHPHETGYPPSRERSMEGDRQVNGEPLERRRSEPVQGDPWPAGLQLPPPRAGQVPRTPRRRQHLAQ